MIEEVSVYTGPLGGDQLRYPMASAECGDKWSPGETYNNLPTKCLM